MYKELTDRRSLEGAIEALKGNWHLRSQIKKELPLKWMNLKVEPTKQKMMTVLYWNTQYYSNSHLYCILFVHQKVWRLQISMNNRRIAFMKIVHSFCLVKKHKVINKNQHKIIKKEMIRLPFEPRQTCQLVHLAQGICSIICHKCKNQAAHDWSLLHGSKKINK